MEPHTTEPESIARRIRLAFGAVSVVAALMCGLLLAVVYDVSGLVRGMRHDEASIRQGTELVSSVRELSLHIAHSVIEGDDSHVARYESWRQKVRRQLQGLSSRLPEAEHSRLRQVAVKTQRMHELFVGEALPAVRRGDRETARSVHRQIERLGEDVSVQADVLAQAAAGSMVHAHVEATSSTRVGIAGGVACLLLIVGLSMYFASRLRRMLSRPLELLADAAREFGAGHFERRVGRVGTGELATVASAFDAMANELAAREARLVRQERIAAIGQLAAGVAHELNNPIGIIRGYLQTMSPETEPDALRRELLILDEEAAQCQRIAEDLVDYARSRDLDVVPIDVGSFLRDVVGRFDGARGEAGAAQTTVELEEDVTAEVDGQRLRQVISNLLTNAWQMSPSDGSVVLRCRSRTDAVVIQVEDEGPGIPSEDQQRIFEPFYTKRPGGSGLGLAVCQGIVRGHHGTIEVLDAPGGGAIFQVVLPRRAQASVAPLAEDVRAVEVE